MIAPAAGGCKRMSGGLLPPHLVPEREGASAPCDVGIVSSRPPNGTPLYAKLEDTLQAKRSSRDASSHPGQKL